MGNRPVCCPYFFNQIAEFMEIPENPGFTFLDILQVDVTTTLPGQRVRLGAMVEAAFATESQPATYTCRLTFRLVRSGFGTLTEADWHLVDFPKPTGITTVFRNLQNLTWTDVPGPPGTYTYILQVRRGTGIFEGNIEDINVRARHLDAIVFPPQP